MVESISSLDIAHKRLIKKKSKFQSLLHQRTCPSFQVFYLSNDRGQSVKIEETSKIDIKKLISHLELGESIFIKSMNA